jgi:hypothetical protein
VAFLKKACLFIVRDTLESLDGKPHAYQALLHLDAENVDLDRESGAVETQESGAANIRIVPFSDGDLKTRIIRGQESPVVQGWLPRGHGIRGVRPIPTVIYERRSAKPVSFLTVLQPLRDGSEDRVSTVNQYNDKVTIGYSNGKTIHLSLPPK